MQDAANQRLTDGEPLGAVGICRCGAGPHATESQRCARGHVLTANTLPVVTGARSVAFWSAVADVRREIRDAVIEDAGHDLDAAPRTLSLGADGLAQAALIRDSAFLRIIEEGGPFTTSSRSRRAFTVWEKASAAVERHVRVLGITRKPRPTRTLADVLAEHEEQADA